MRRVSSLIEVKGNLLILACQVWKQEGTAKSARQLAYEAQLLVLLVYYDIWRYYKEILDGPPKLPQQQFLETIRFLYLVIIFSR